MKKVDRMGHRYGRLVVQSAAPSEKGYSMWHCQCDCGNETTVRGSNLQSGQVQSCGCLAREKASQRWMGNKHQGHRWPQRYHTVEDVLANCTQVGECLEWNGALHRNGYAKIGKTKMFKTQLLHREIYLYLHPDEAPEVVMHTCDNPKCINPNHLKGGTQQDNVDDMMAKGRHWRQK